MVAPVQRGGKSGRPHPSRPAPPSGRSCPAAREEDGMYRGLIAAAGFGARLQDLGEKRNKVLLDLGGESILSSILSNFEQAGISEPLVVVGYDAPAVRTACGTR